MFQVWMRNSLGAETAVFAKKHAGHHTAHKEMDRYVDSLRHPTVPTTKVETDWNTGTREWSVRFDFPGDLHELQGIYVKEV